MAREGVFSFGSLRPAAALIVVLVIGLLVGRSATETEPAPEAEPRPRNPAGDGLHKRQGHGGGLEAAEEGTALSAVASAHLQLPARARGQEDGDAPWCPSPGRLQESSMENNQWA